MPGVNWHKGESKRFVSVFSGKHTSMMDLCKEPFFAIITMPFKRVVMDVTPCVDHQESDYAQARSTKQAARDQTKCDVADATL
jgi:hypothetical protein